MVIVWERPNFFESAAIKKALDRCLRASELAPDQIDLYDFYSYVSPRWFRTTANMFSVAFQLCQNLPVII
jgi:hypothetical protein